MIGQLSGSCPLKSNKVNERILSAGGYTIERIMPAETSESCPLRLQTVRGVARRYPGFVLGGSCPVSSSGPLRAGLDNNLITCDALTT